MRRRKQARWAGLLVLICLSAAGFGQKTPSQKYESPLLKAPAEAAARQNPYAGNPDAILAGKKLFRHHCDECHGVNAEGTRRAPPLITPWVQGAEPGTIFWLLTNGNLKRGMPSWSELPPQRRWQIVTYLKSLSAEETRSNSQSSHP